MSANKELIDREELDKALALFNGEKGRIFQVEMSTITHLVNQGNVLADAVRKCLASVDGEVERRVLAENKLERTVHETAEKLTAMEEDAFNGKAENRARTIILTRSANMSPHAKELANREAKGKEDPFYYYGSGYWMVQEDGKILEGLGTDEAMYAAFQLLTSDGPVRRFQPIEEIIHRARATGKRMAENSREPVSEAMAFGTALHEAVLRKADVVSADGVATTFKTVRDAPEGNASQAELYASLAHNMGVPFGLEPEQQAKANATEDATAFTPAPEDVTASYKSNPGHIPVAGDVQVEVLLANSTVNTGEAKRFQWERGGWHHRVIAYRVIEAGKE